MHGLRVVCVAHGPITNVVGGMGAPGRIAFFPPLETVQTRRVHHHPYVAGTKVIILVTDHAHIFTAIPNVTVWNRRSNCRRRDDYLWRSYDNRRSRCLAGISQSQRNSHHSNREYCFQIRFHLTPFVVCGPAGGNSFLYALAVPLLLLRAIRESQPKIPINKAIRNPAIRNPQYCHPWVVCLFSNHGGWANTSGRCSTG